MSAKCQRCAAPHDDEAGAVCEPCLVERLRPAPPLDVEAMFAKGGPLAAGNPAYEARPGQVRLARGIFDALAQGHHLLAEGPCGIGKSKAYGVPAAHLAAHGKRVLIVTASIALQEQLVKKDLPALQDELEPAGLAFDFALMKGKSNYLCREQAGLSDSAGLQGQDADDFRAVSAWARATLDRAPGVSGVGDKSELLIKPSDLVWGRFSTSSDACPGKKCPSHASCFATRARDRAANAGVIVTNYHLFFLNMAYGGQVLPAFDVVILDEAHEAADIARDLLGFRLSEHTFRRFANDADKRGARDVGRDLRTQAAAFFDRLARFHDSPHYKAFLRWPAIDALDPATLEQAVDRYAQACAKSHLLDGALLAKARLRAALELSDPNCVYWIEARPAPAGERRRCALQARYVSVAPVLREQLWDACPSVVAVSATLTTDGRFDFVRRELGVPADGVRELAVDSPFDFPHQAMLVTPPAHELPEPNDAAFVEVAARRVIEVIEACGGRTLGLFTSYRALDAIAERVRRHFAGRLVILTQRDGPAALLARRFKDDARSVLLGTTSFWTGIDVPGEALTGLVIDRLPFGGPDDPVAIRVAEADPRAFANFTVPKAILVFRQGIGRLIRSQKDVGVAVVLDKRLSSKSYGSRFLRSLPPMTRAASTTAIAPFLRSKGVAA